MNIEQRKPRPTRFATESPEARLAHLREKAPTLVAGRNLRLYAVFGSVLLCLTVAAFYFAMRIYDTVTQQREEASLIEVDQAPEVELSEAEKALQEIQQEEADRQQAYEEKLQALQEVDLLGETEKPSG